MADVKLYYIIFICIVLAAFYLFIFHLPLLNPYYSSIDAIIENNDGALMGTHITGPVPGIPVATLTKKIPLPVNFTWNRYKGKNWLLPVRDQGKCGGCWAFSVTSMFGDRLKIQSRLDSQNNKLTYKIPDFIAQNMNLSAQYLINCIGPHGVRGVEDCRGVATIHDGAKLLLECVNTNTGKIPGGTHVDDQTCFPYVDGEGGVGRCYATELIQQPPDVKARCKLESAQLYYLRQIYEIIDNSASFEENIRRIKTEIYSYGPVTTGIHVYDDLMDYKASDGVYRARNSANLVGGHAVEIVGWGVSAGIEYWVIKNSWSSNWGDNGYWKQAINDPLTFPKDKMSFISGFLQLTNPFNTKHSC